MPKRLKPQSDLERVGALSRQQKDIFYRWCQGWTLRLFAKRAGKDESSIQQQFYRIVHDKFEVEFFDIAERNRILKERFCPYIGQFVDETKLPPELPQLESGEQEIRSEPTLEEQLAIMLLVAEDDAREEGKPPEAAIAIFRALIPKTPQSTEIDLPPVIDIEARRIRRWPPLLTFILGVLTIPVVLAVAFWQGWLPLTVNTPVPVLLTAPPLPTFTPLSPLPTYTPLAPLPTFTPFSPLPTYTTLPPLPTYTPPPIPSPLVEATQTSLPLPTITPTLDATPVVTPTISISVPFEDTFDKDKRPEWRLADGNYLVEGGHLSPGTAGTFILELGNIGLTDYTVELDYSGSFLYRFGESLRMNIDTSIGYDCYLETVQDGQWIRLRQITCPPGGHFKGRVSGNIFTVSYNDTVIFDFAYETQSKNRGPFRFRISNGTVDNFKLTVP